MKKTRVTTIIGTRPELIRLALIIKRLDEVFEHRLIHTGQNSDSNLSKVLHYLFLKLKQQEGRHFLRHSQQQLQLESLAAFAQLKEDYLNP